MATTGNRNSLTEDDSNPEVDPPTLSDTLDFTVFDLEAEPPEPYSSLVSVEFEGLSHTGHVRERNEDAFLVYRVSRSWERLGTSLPEGDLPSHFDENAYAFCVADGMGGAAAGDVASSLALRTGVNLVLNSAKWWLKLDHPQTRDRAIQALVARALRRFRQIDRTLVDRANEDPSLLGMGTTLTVACSFGADLVIFHTGDSRVYLFRNGTLEQLTRDQTVAQAMLEAGQITSEQAKSHRWRHQLTGVLGGQESMDAPEAHIHRLQDGDRLLLCTDGLTNMLDDDAIAEIVAHADSMESGCRRLVDEALQRGGRDNVTVVLAQYSLPSSAC
ncbi:MAG: protein phosphatase 2C domain-containing protein [Planctomycetes bacterium]|nr:protein phosphatase 2C domain-containing protein [Planctomycetota bacterium]